MPTRVELVGASVVSSNPAPFNTSFCIRVVLNVLEGPPKGKVDVKFTWSPIWDFPVDQELDELEVGPLDTLGKHSFDLECDAPSLDEIPDPTGPTALMVSLMYGGKEFMHLGFNIEVSCTLHETPEVYSDPSVLIRKIGRCYQRASEISWDEAADTPSSSSVRTTNHIDFAHAIQDSDLERMVAAGVGSHQPLSSAQADDDDASEDGSDWTSDDEDEEGNDKEQHQGIGVATPLPEEPPMKKARHE